MHVGRIIQASFVRSPSLYVRKEPAMLARPLSAGKIVPIDFIRSLPISLYIYTVHFVYFNIIEFNIYYLVVNEVGD